MRHALTLLTLLLFCGNVVADQGIFERAQSWLDEMDRGMRKVGERAGGLFGPGLDMDTEKEAAYTANRDFSDQRETGPKPVVNVTNEYGEIHIDVWEARVVQVSAKVVVGAESASVAEEVSRAINISIEEKDNGVYIRPILPEHHRDMGAINKQVNLYIKVPRDAQVFSANYFGDTYIRGVEGPVTLDSHFGIVDLAEIGGTLNARMRGDFPVRAVGLEMGGYIQLQRGRAELSQIGGSMRVSAFDSLVSIGSLKDDTQLDLVTESSTVNLVLAPDSAPDLTATSHFGSIDSDLPVTRTEQGNRILARHGSADARQRIDISSVYSAIQIRYAGDRGKASAVGDNDDKHISNTVREEVVVTPYTKISVEGLVGDIQLEGTDEPGVHIAATRVVWVPNDSKAPGALEALALRIEHDKATDQLTIRTVLTADMETLQCSQYRVNLEIRYPRTLPVTVTGEDGRTQVSGNVAPVSIDQTTGVISALRFAGPLTLNNKNGGIRITGGTGAVTAKARYGDIHLERPGGDVSVTGQQGDIIIDSPAAGVSVRNNLGNVRILALKGVAGDYDVLVEEGDLSLVLGALPAANLNVSVDGGSVVSVYPLSSGGILGRRKAEYKNYVGEGAFSMQLIARNGDIVLD